MIASEILKSWKQKDSVDRETVQNTLYEFFKFHGNVFMMLATGVGKSKSALQCVENRKTLIICERIPHIENWKKEIEKFSIKTGKILPRRKINLGGKGRPWVLARRVQDWLLPGPVLLRQVKGGMLDSRSCGTRCLARLGPGLVR
jgi:hypothetical protein